MQLMEKRLHKQDFWTTMALLIVDFQLFLIFILLLVFSLQCLSAFFFKKPKESDCDLPPSPPSLPVIGHLHLLLSVSCHRALQKLSLKMIMGRKCSEENGEAEQIRDLVTKSVNLARKFLIASTVGRLLKKIKISLFEKEIMEVSQRFDVLLEKIIKEHEENPNKKEDKDMMDILLEVWADENADYKITRNQIKGLFVELFLGGTDTSAQTTQWIMAELINHPEILKRLREEIESVVGKTTLIQETDLSDIPYLQAVVKEGLRLHPPAPILVRNATEGCKIRGFNIPQNITMVINTYAVMRDPNAWEDPDKFQPERFIVSPSKGQDDENENLALNYLPFGGGRRGCPGSNLGYNFVGVAIGVMVQCFDWRIDGDKVNMEETGDVTLSMAHPLKCTPVARMDPLASFESTMP